MDQPVPDEKVQQVRELIAEHQGVDNIINSRELAERVGIEDDDTRTKTRKTVRYLVVEEEMVIGSKQGRGGGYFIIETVDELMRHLDGLQDEIDGTLQRMRAVRKLWKWEGVSEDEIPL